MVCFPIINVRSTHGGAITNTCISRDYSLYLIADGQGVTKATQTSSPAVPVRLEFNRELGQQGCLMLSLEVSYAFLITCPLGLFMQPFAYKEP